MNKIIVAGKHLDVEPLSKCLLKGIFADVRLSYYFYKTDFNGRPFCLLIPKNETNLAPLGYKQLSDRLETIISLPIVFIFESLAYYQRNRLIERGVFFIVSNKYAYLPYLIVNAKQADKKPIEQLSPTAQYILLFHLQEQTLQGLTIKEIEKLIPYKYVTITRAIICLEELSLCRSERGLDRCKRVYFDINSSILWEKSQPYLENPIRKVVYCDSIMESENIICGINALAHYSNLGQGTKKMFAIEENTFKKLDIENRLCNLNEIEGDVTIQVWKYHPMTNIEELKLVDKLSLYLTLKDDKEPSVVRELENMIYKL